VKTAGVILALALLCYTLVCAGFFVGQRALIYFPVLNRDETVEATTLRRDGVALRVSVHRAASPRAVVYFGGNAEDVSRAMPVLRAAFPDTAIHALHYRGYGGSTGRPTEEALVDDGVALMADVATRHAAIAMVGRSLGSGVAMQVAARHPPARLVLVTPFDRMGALARHHYPWLPAGLLLRERYESAAHAPDIRVPTTLVVASRDSIVPPERARALASAFAPGVARSIVLEGAGHNDIDAHPGYIAALAGTASR
jgi:pimeloyl-ACP methyl ester carboxylesterase